MDQQSLGTQAVAVSCPTFKLLGRIHQNGQKCCCQVIPGVEANLDWNELLTGVLSLRREEESKICDFYSIMRIVCFSVMSFI